MTQEIRGRTIGQFALVDATTLDPETARIPVWREEQADGNRVASITPEGLKALLIAGGLLTQDATDDLYAPIGGAAGGGPTVVFPYAASGNYVLPIAPQRPDRVQLFVNGAKQQYGVDYAIFDTVLTWASSLTLSIADTIEVYL